MRRSKEELVEAMLSLWEHHGEKEYPNFRINDHNEVMELLNMLLYLVKAE